MREEGKRMKKDITCSIVQDLLPSYIEHLTSDETNLVVKEHLGTCEECRSIQEAMVKEVTEVEKAPKAELKFFRKIRKTKLIAAGISILLTLILTYVVYAMEFSYALDKTELSLAVTNSQRHLIILWMPMLWKPIPLEEIFLFPSRIGIRSRSMALHSS